MISVIIAGCKSGTKGQTSCPVWGKWDKETRPRVPFWEKWDKGTGPVSVLGGEVSRKDSPCVP